MELSTPTERVALVVWNMTVYGWTPTTAEVARKVGISRKGAHALMLRISNVLPLYQDNHRWVLLH